MPIRRVIDGTEIMIPGSSCFCSFFPRLARLLFSAGFDRSIGRPVKFVLVIPLGHTRDGVCQACVRKLRTWRRLSPLRELSVFHLFLVGHRHREMPLKDSPMKRWAGLFSFVPSGQPGSGLSIRTKGHGVKQYDLWVMSNSPREWVRLWASAQSSAERGNDGSTRTACRLSKGRLSKPARLHTA